MHPPSGDASTHDKRRITRGRPNKRQHERLKHTNTTPPLEFITPPFAWPFLSFTLRRPTRQHPTSTIPSLLVTKDLKLLCQAVRHPGFAPDLGISFISRIDTTLGANGFYSIYLEPVQLRPPLSLNQRVSPLETKHSLLGGGLKNIITVRINAPNATAGHSPHTLSHITLERYLPPQVRIRQILVQGEAR